MTKNKSEREWEKCIEEIEKYLKYYTSAASCDAFGEGKIEAFEISIGIIKSHMPKRKKK